MIFQKKNIFLIGVFFALGCSPFLKNQPYAKEQKIKNCAEIEKIVNANNANCRIVQLNDYDKEFQKYFVKNNQNAHPGYLYADFNGDKILDYAILVRCASNTTTVEKFIIMLGTNTGGFKLLQIEQWVDALSLNNLFIRLIAAGKVEEYDSSKIQYLKLPGVELNLFESASQVYYWNIDRFSFIQTSD